MKLRRCTFTLARLGTAATMAASLQLALAQPAPDQARRHHENDLGGGLPAKSAAKAAAKSAAGATGRNAPSHVSRAGGIERHLWIDAGSVAEFGGDGPPRIRAADPGEVDAIQRSSGAQAKGGTWKPQPATGAATSATETGATPVSPVFRDASGRPRALPGGVIVSIGHDLPEEQARATLEAAGLSPLRRIGERMWLVDSPPGIASLELANRLQDQGGFGFAQPNWWQPKVTK